MNSEAKTVLRINYKQGEEPRFIKGFLRKETEEYIEIELNKYLTRIYKKHIIKIEVEKNSNGRDYFEY